MTAVFDYVVRAVVQNTMFAGLVLIILIALKNTSAKIRYAIALLGLLKLLVPPFVPVANFSLFGFLLKTAPSQHFEIGPIAPFFVDPSAAEKILDYRLWILAGWVFFFLIFITVPIINTIKLKSFLRGSTRLDPFRLPQSTKIKFFECYRLELPLSMGILQPKIYLPPVWKNWSVQQITAVIEHEKHHIKYRDTLIKSLQILVQAIYFFHPLVWVLNNLMTDYREMACDDAAVVKSQTSPLQYSKILLSLAEKMAQSQLGYSPASALIRQKHNLLKRIHYQIKEKKNMKIKISIFVTLILCAGVLLSTYCTEKRPVDDVSDTFANESDFTAFDTAPQPIGGFAAVQKNLVYPEAARKAGVEGRVFIQAVIDAKGQVINTTVTQSLGDTGCDEAAIHAIKSVKWGPALQSGKPVKASVSIPVVFKLR